MNPGQQKFQEFILGDAAEKNQDKARELLAEAFAKQDADTSDAAHQQAFMPCVLALIEPECVGQVLSVMKAHKAQKSWALRMKGAHGDLPRAPLL